MYYARSARPYLPSQWNSTCILASTAREDVGMKHIVTAVAHEYIKMGKQVTDVHFGEWYEFVRTI